MRIIYLANIRLPTEKAHGIQIMKMCSAFSRLGFGVELVVPTRRNQITADPFTYYGVAKTFKITRLPAVDLVNVFPKYGSWVSHACFMIATKAYLFFKTSDVLYIRGHLSGLFFRNFVLEIHTLPKKIRPADLRVWQRARKLVAITNALKEELVKLGIPGDKILVAPDGVDLEKFQISNDKFQNRKQLGLPVDKNIIMYTGHLYEWKGAGVLLDAARNSKFPARLRLATKSLAGGQIPNTKFVFVGGTEEDIKKFKDKAKGLENVMILGHKPHNDIPQYLAAADVLVLPNSAKSAISKFHTSPLKLFEYMAANRPIVASDIPSIREILNDQSAVLVEPDNPAALAEGIGKVLSNFSLGERISAAALTRVEQYSWTRRAKNIADFVV